MPNGTTYDQISAAEKLEQAASMLDWPAMRREQAALRSQGRYIGLGLSLYVEPSAVAFGSWATEEASIRLTPGGSVTVAIGTGSHGQSIETTIAQVVADELGC